MSPINQDFKSGELQMKKKFQDNPQHLRRGQPLAGSHLKAGLEPGFVIVSLFGTGCIHCGKTLPVFR